MQLLHIDLYRISGAEEALGLGLGEFLGAPYAVCVIEWAERAASLMPSDHLWVELEFVDWTRRALSFTARGERHQKLLQDFRQVSFGA
jgi:tRNA threonylcarbamoyladenosine biosynthesis protein TsaE